MRALEMNNPFRHVLLFALLICPVAAQSSEAPVVPKWQRFERAFRSSILYSNALHDAILTVTFTSPLGKTSQVQGFWDGGHTWRVRFAPNQLGRWTYQTECSDSSNSGLNGQRGEFVCSAPIATGRFWQHGPIRVALDLRYFEHEDGTPFFWLADTVWNGAWLSQPREWEKYAVVRASQRFSVVQWLAAPGKDDEGQAAIAQIGDRLAVNPDYFKRLDQKVQTLNRAGLLNAVILAPEISPVYSGDPALPDSETVLLAEYIVARYGAEPIAWLLPCNGQTPEKCAAFWKSHGPSLFSRGGHAPVIVYAEKIPALLDQFRQENWVDAFGCPSVSGSDKEPGRVDIGFLAREAQEEPARPLIPFLPFENSIIPDSGTRFSAEIVRRAAYESLLSTPPAGISYGAQGVADWDRSVQQANPADLPVWEKSMFMPGAKQMGILADFANSLDYWRLKPDPSVAGTETAEHSQLHEVAAAFPDTAKLAAVYIPKDRMIEIPLTSMPPAPKVSWLNPRNGSVNPAVGVVGSSGCQFPTPEPGDWLLVIKRGKG
jgi:Protein of unknown function (DUF4038)/Domain of unknown function (DUF5060)/Putative collagen-binding domain of a collagenase